MDTFPAYLAPGLWRQYCGEFATTPLRVDGARLERILVDQAIEMLFHLTRDFGGGPERG